MERVSLCEKQDSVEDGWVALPDLIQAQQLEQGYVMFIAVQGYYWSRLRITYTGGFWFDTTEEVSGVTPNGRGAAGGVEAGVVFAVPECVEAMGEAGGGNHGAAGVERGGGAVGAGRGGEGIAEAV